MRKLEFTWRISWQHLSLEIDDKWLAALVCMLTIALALKGTAAIIGEVATSGTARST